MAASARSIDYFPAELQMRFICRQNSRDGVALCGMLKEYLRPVEKSLDVSAHVSTLDEGNSENDTYKLFVRMVCESAGKREFENLLLDFFSIWTSLRKTKGSENSKKEPLFFELCQDAAFRCPFDPRHSWKYIADINLGYFLGIGEFFSVCAFDRKAYDVFFCDFEHDIRRMEIVFAEKRSKSTHDKYTTRYKMSVSYKALNYVTVDYDQHWADIYLTVKYPPLLWKWKHFGGHSSHNEAIVSLPFCCRETFGSCSVIMLRLKTTQAIEDEMLWALICRLKRRARVPVYFGRVTIEPLTKLPDHEMTEASWNFDCQYYWCALKSRSLSVASQMDSNFADQLLTAFERNQKATEHALSYLLSLVDQLQEIFLPSSFKKYFDKYDSLNLAELEKMERSESDDGMVRVRKVVFTPTRTLLTVPDTMLSNRVIRRFGAEWALRVSFRSDNGGRMRAFSFNSDDIDEVLRRPLRDGLTIGDRHYEFLGWSNSQLRDGGCYFYCRTAQGECVSDIRKWMGNFDGIGNVPKLMSRMGQCFTQSLSAVEIPYPIGSSEVPIQEDHFSQLYGEKVFCFSDGVGQISVQLAEEVSEKLNLSPVPSAFQIRFAGCKGMLAVNPRLPEVQKMVFRESMLKFRTETSNVLEIVKTSQPCPVNLNRPLILILDQVAECENPLVRQNMQRRINELLNEQLYGLSDMLLLESCASRELPKSVQLGINFKSLSEVGIRMTNEVFFRNMMLSIYSSKVKEQLLKLKIDVPTHLGRTLFGILDETRTLAPDEVFIQISTDINEPGKNLKVIEGAVMVTKSPCIVPGDVRILNAVKTDLLMHLRDVIVFPRIGLRPVMDQMAGSDLDGDEYLAFWDTDLMFTGNYDPLSFPKTDVPKFEGEITTEAMIDFFITYLCSDSIGTIATSHMVAADRFGIFSDVPMQLANKHTMAVDFPKTGIVPEKLTCEERIEKYPDYLWFGSRPTYRSKWLPGPMTRRVRSVIDIIDLSSVRSFDASVDFDLAYGNWKDFAANAARTYSKYRQLVFSLLSEYGIDNEFQLFSGHFTDLKGRLSRGERDDYSLFTTERIVQMRLKRLIAKFRNQFAREFEVDSSELATNEKALAKASAWYMVAYRDRTVVNSRSAFSFGWLMWDLLAVIKERRVKNPKAPCNPVMDHLEQLIEKTSVRKFEHLKESLSKCGVTSNYNEGIKHVLYIYLEWCLRSHLVTEADSKEALFTFVGTFDRFLKDLKSSPQLPFDMITTDETGKFVISFLSKGQLLMKFFKYLGTQAGDTNRSQANEHADALRALVDLAFKAYHKAALSGDFSSFYLEQPKRVESDAEEMDPITFLPTPTIEQLYGMEHVCEKLRIWSGVTDLRYREKGSGYYLISAIGTLEARFRLCDLLTCDDLESALKYDTCPF
ncbi:RNA dependent RNA polymerase family protein [Trichuris trichiura]|uniref:RNA-dependent RNA polymerase n=1 Tax=Trichuris trichiura TaxID=36087 RepID=A0A077ZKK4_TRITR|nr:RNA dependent RNA polymerase family protein [Trichuris trichiura]